MTCDRKFAEDANSFDDICPTEAACAAVPPPIPQKRPRDWASEVKEEKIADAFYWGKELKLGDALFGSLSIGDRFRFAGMAEGQYGIVVGAGRYQMFAPETPMHGKKFHAKSRTAVFKDDTDECEE